MGRNVSLEILWVPQFSDQFPKPCDQLKALIPGWPGLEDVHVILWTEEVVPHPLDVGEQLENNVHVVIGLDVVQANHAGNVFSPVKGSCLLRASSQLGDQLRGECRVEDVEDVVYILFSIIY